LKEVNELKTLLLFFSLFPVMAATTAWSDPVEDILTYYDPSLPGHYHFFDENDSFALFFEPQDFGIDSLVITGIRFESTMAGPISIIFCEDDTSSGHPLLDHFPGTSFFETNYFFSGETWVDTVMISPIRRKDNSGIWLIIVYQVENIPFLTSGTSPPSYRNLVHNRAPSYWWPDIDDWSVGLVAIFERPTGIKPGTDPPDLPTTFALNQNYPNPFNPSTNIGMELPRDCEIKLSIYDARGRLIRRLINQKLGVAGHYEVVWDGKNDRGVPVSSGIYLYRLAIADRILTRKMILLK